MKLSRKIIASCAVAAMAMGALAGCGAGTSSAQDDGTITIGFSPITMNNPYWQAVLEGIQSAADKSGKKISIQQTDPQNDQTKQNDQIGDLIASQVDAIIMSPYDSTGIQPALQAAADANIPVINVDQAVTDTSLVKTIINSDNKKAGALLAQDMKKKLPEGSQVAFLTVPGAQSCIDRIAGFKEESNGYFEVVQELDGKADMPLSLTLTEDILQANPNIGAIVGVSDIMAQGAFRALESHPDKSNVLVYGIDGNPDVLKAIKEGKVAGDSAQSPHTMGEKGLEAALDIIDGKEVDKQQTVDVTFIDQDNIDQYGTDNWL